ncbi:hypothetical protein JANAI62_29520 [Jannaschia pagri]|uniref:Uncharacterized protein n=1 Tax=Jannaschia pagri TaxID=2829797 RepID=A0ABQ4NQ14_9RHOB|nr:hypothetical protein JANAI61_29520 [Jannaschia sp. AI_61]GIT96329.1 hypothetical protein JANAI62_29520 [Jannaschia sp. AI_62]
MGRGAAARRGAGAAALRGARAAGAAVRGGVATRRGAGSSIRRGVAAAGALRITGSAAATGAVVAGVVAVAASTEGRGVGAAVTWRGSGAGVGAGATVGVSALRDGAAPQTTLRSRFTRGTQRVAPSTPARMKMHPRLSTYCAPVKLLGGISAGPEMEREPCAQTPLAAAIALAATTPIAKDLNMPNSPFVRRPPPRRFFRTLHDRPIPSKVCGHGKTPLFRAKHAVTRIP